MVEQHSTIWFLWFYGRKKIYGRWWLAEEDVEDHHEKEAEGETYGACVGVFTLLGFGDEFLNHDIEHGAGGESEKIGENRHYDRGENNRQDGCQRFNDTGKRTHEERLATGVPRAVKGH